MGLLPFFSPLLRSPSLFPSPIFPCFPSASLFPPLFLLHFHFIPFPYFSAPCPFFPSLSPPLKLATRSGGAQRGPERSSGRQRISCILTPVNRRLISEIFRYHDVRKNFTKLKPTSALLDRVPAKCVHHLFTAVKLGARGSSIGEIIFHVHGVYPILGDLIIHYL